MKILHTSDWHLGKKLEGIKRIEEQKLFIEKLNEIVKSENPDIILIAGDIFDIPNPPSDAETLFFDAMKKISDFGKRAVIIIPGNHDSGERLAVSKNLAKEFGIIIYEKIFEKKEVGKYGKFEIINSTNGGVELSINNQKVFVYCLPYISEVAINEYIKEEISYSKKICNILENGINHVDKSIPIVIMAHLFIGGSEGDGDERGIEIYGSKGVELEDLPEVDYIALGHIHKPMKYLSKRACYSGSPIEYRVSENKYRKKIIVARLQGKLNTEIKEIELENYKPIKRYEVNGAEEAIEFINDKKDSNEWIYLKINSKDYLSSGTIKELVKNKNVIDIQVNMITDSEFIKSREIKELELNIHDNFKEYYRNVVGIEPKEEVVRLFMDILEGNN